MYNMVRKWKPLINLVLAFHLGLYDIAGRHDVCENGRTTRSGRRVKRRRDDDHFYF